MAPSARGLLAAAAPRLCPDAVEARGSVVAVATYQLDKDTGDKRGELCLYELVRDPGGDEVAWRERFSAACSAVFDAKWCVARGRGGAKRA